MSTIAEKLRLQPGQSVTVLNRPNQQYFAEFAVSEEEPRQPVALLILFVYNLEQLQQWVPRLIKKQILIPDGRLLLVYPKKGNRAMDAYIHRDHIFPALHVDADGYIQDTDYKFHQMVKLDDIYTIVGLKRVKRDTAKQRSSQRAADYSQFIPRLEQVLRKEPEAMAFWQGLTPGYQRNWARYVYSAKQQTTQEKRIQEMIGLLKQNVKAKK